MPGSKRLGIPHEIELDARMRKAEKLLQSRQVAEIAAGEGARAVQRVAGEPPPKVENLVVVSNLPGAISLRWTPSATRDLLFYEIEVSTSPSFLRAETDTFSEPEPRFLFTTADDLEATYYFRVRAVNKAGVGLFSDSINGTTGLAEAVHIQLGAAKQGVTLVQSVFTPSTLTPGDVAEYGFTEIETIGGVLLVMAIPKIEYENTTSGFNTEVFFRIKENGVNLHEFSMTQTDINLIRMRTGFPYFLATGPPAGVHVYSIEIEIPSSATDLTHFEILELRVSAVEVRA